MGVFVKICDSVQELSAYFAELLASEISKTPENRSFSWMLSGGSTPGAVFREIAPHLRETANWDVVRIFWGDERCVGPSDAESNYRMARENLLDHVPVPPGSIFRIRGEANPEEEARRYSQVFERHVRLQHGTPVADLVMLGLGEDGHTASIFPANMELFSSTALFATAEHPSTGQKRITATGRVINQAKTVVVLATGHSKAAMVARIIRQTSGWDDLPASRINPRNGRIIWLLDTKSAINLT